MKKKWKFLFIALLLLSLLFFSFLKLATPHFVLHSLKQAQPFSSLQNQIAIKKVSWALFPEPGIKLFQVETLKNASLPLSFKIDELHLSLSTKALMAGEALIKNVKVEGLNITVSANKTSVLPFFNTLLHHELPMIREVFITHANITYKTADTTLILDKFQAVLKNVSASKTNIPIQAKSNFLLKTGNFPEIKSNLTFKGQLHEPLSTTPSLTGQLSMQKLNLDKLILQQLSATLELNQHVLTLNPFQATLYQGESTGTIYYDFDKQIIALKQSATHLNSSELTEHLSEKTWLEGMLDISFQTNFSNRSEVFDHAFSFSGSLAMKEGKIHWSHLPKKTFIPAFHRIKVTSPTTTNSVQQLLTPSLQFDVMALQFHLNDKRFKTESFFLKTKALSLKGNGHVMLKNNLLSWNVEAFPNLNSPQTEPFLPDSIKMFRIKLKGTTEDPIMVPETELESLSLNWLNDLLNPFRRS